MAFVTSQLALVQHVNGYNYFRYDTDDAHAVVDGDGYFNNSDDDQKINVGDLIDVVVWDTLRTGTPQTYGQHLVLSVSAAGVVDLTNVTVGLMTDSD